MPLDGGEEGTAGAWVTVLDEREEYRYNDQFRIVRAELRYRRSDGKMSKPLTRISFERGDSVGVLLYDPKLDEVILVRQFRYPVYSGLEAGEQMGEGAAKAWLLEIVAGVHDPGKSIYEVAHLELLEEAGYRVQRDLQAIATVYPSPGGSSERIHLFLGYVDRKSQVGPGGGTEAGGEDTSLVRMSLNEENSVTKQCLYESA